MIKKAALIIAAMILYLALTGCNTSKSRDSMTRWLTDNREAWDKIISAHQTGRRIRYDRELADQWSSLFRDGRLREISYNPDTGDCNLDFNGTDEIPEGDRYLVFSGRSMEEIAPLGPLDDPIIQQKTESRLYYTGIGAGGRGYVLVERIEENWYYIEYYYPT
ncbi:MAG: hypothetical protein IKP22_12860 [Clostridia bacterium]|nr:hypothetical protein [Clostridia bacterium]MBR6088563.1 hypothetical protein [Anaerolineaceae bacterium]